MKLDIFVERNGSSLLAGSLDTQPGVGEGFTYSEQWLSLPSPHPLSLSLPLQEERFSARQVRPYFEGLLPEGRPRAAVARELHLPASSYAKILAALGWECIGAITLKGSEPEPEEAYEGLDDGRLEEMARALTDRAVWMNRNSRFSLAGGQPKIALLRDAERGWRRPVGSAPSSHILKPTHVQFSDAAVNEAVCTTAADILGLSVPKVDVVPTEIPMICTERFDRAVDRTSRVIDGCRAPHRLHQEDFSQAMAVVPAHKYEEGNHRGYAAKMGEVVRLYSADPLTDLTALWKALVFNYLIGNCDAHLKNYALVRDADWKSLRLAPLYDLLGTSCYEGLSTEMAMAIGGKKKLEQIDSDAFARQAKEMGLPANLVMRQASDLARGTLDAIEKAALTLGDKGVQGASEVAEKLAPGIQERAARLM